MRVHARFRLHTPQSATQVYAQVYAKQIAMKFLPGFLGLTEDCLAERVGFEPTVGLHPQQFSRLPQSATLAPLQEPASPHAASPAARRAIRLIPPAAYTGLPRAPQLSSINRAKSIDTHRRPVITRSLAARPCLAASILYDDTRLD
jgi:hypothetical protein